MDLSLRSTKTNNWSGDNFKKPVTSMSCTLELAIQSYDTGQRIPFWQLSINHNMHVHKDVQVYQVKHRLYMPWTPSW